MNTHASSAVSVGMSAMSQRCAQIHPQMCLRFRNPNSAIKSYRSQTSSELANISIPVHPKCFSIYSSSDS